MMRRRGFITLLGGARALAARGVPIARGGSWTSVQVSAILQREKLAPLDLVSGAVIIVSTVMPIERRGGGDVSIREPAVRFSSRKRKCLLA